MDDLGSAAPAVPVPRDLIPAGAAAIRALRGPKDPTDARVPAGFSLEREPREPRRDERPPAAWDVAVMLLTGAECAFTCLHCDLWKYTLDGPTPPGGLPAQIDACLAGLPPVGGMNRPAVKLYNASNWADPRAVPDADLPAIAGRLRGFERAVVENHPRLTRPGPAGERLVRFRDLLAAFGCDLEVALGLETADPAALAGLNKSATADDFAAAADWLIREGMGVRAFVLLRPPGVQFVDSAAAVAAAADGVRFALDCGAGVAAVVPQRAGNGAVDRLAAAGAWVPPTVAELSAVQDAVLPLAAARGRVAVVDAWDAGPAAAELGRRNLAQR